MRDRNSFWKLVASGEILSGLSSPADRRNLEMFCDDYEELRKENDALRAKIKIAKKALNEITSNTKTT